MVLRLHRNHTNFSTCTLDEPIAQRNLNITHATGLANYMLRGLIKAYVELNYSWIKRRWKQLIRVISS